jgi:hypothetical protein
MSSTAKHIPPNPLFRQMRKGNTCRVWSASEWATYYAKNLHSVNKWEYNGYVLLNRRNDAGCNTLNLHFVRHIDMHGRRVYLYRWIDPRVQLPSGILYTTSGTLRIDRNMFANVEDGWTFDVPLALTATQMKRHNLLFAQHVQAEYGRTLFRYRFCGTSKYTKRKNRRSRRGECVMAEKDTEWEPKQHVKQQMKHQDEAVRLGKRTRQSASSEGILPKRACANALSDPSPTSTMSLGTDCGGMAQAPMSKTRRSCPMPWPKLKSSNITFPSPPVPLSSPPKTTSDDASSIRTSSTVSVASSSLSDKWDKTPRTWLRTLHETYSWADAEHRTSPVTVGHRSIVAHVIPTKVASTGMGMSTEDKDRKVVLWNLHRPCGSMPAVGVSASTYEDCFMWMPDSDSFFKV